MVLHRHSQERLRAIARFRIECAGAREIEAFCGIGILDVDRLAAERGMRRDHVVVRLAVAMQLDWIEGHRIARRAAEIILERARPYNFETQRLLFRYAIESAPVRAGDRLGGDKDA